MKCTRYVRIAALPMLLILVGCRTPLPAPERVDPVSPAADTIIRTGNVTFVWNSVENAATYQLQIDDRSTFYSPVLDTSGIAATTLGHFLADGQYYWRVRARSRDSVFGDWSTIRSFTVATCRIVAQMRTQGYPQGLFVRDKEIYVADGQAGLSIYRLEGENVLRFVAGIMDTMNTAWGVTVQGSYAYLAYGRKQLQIVNIASTDSLQMLGSIGYTTGYAYDIEMYDSTHVVVANHGRFSLFDVRDPNFPILLFEPRALARAVVLRDSVAFLACEQVGVMIASLSVQNLPVMHSTLRTPGNARDVAIQGDYLYVADGRAGLTVVDVSDITAPRLVSTLSLPGGGYANKVAVAGNIACVANGTAGLAVIDVTNPNAPFLRSMIKTPEAKAVTITEDGGILATDRDWGLLVITMEEE